MTGRPNSSSTTILSEVVQDIPLWARNGLLLAALAGIIVIVVGSLTGGREETIRLDKWLHGIGYGLLAMLLVLSLRPAYSLGALVLLALVGLGVEYLQPLNARTFDPGDVVANLIGLVTGAGLGFGLRVGARALITWMKRARIQHSRRTYDPGATVLKEGTPLNHFIIIERGRLRLSRVVHGRQCILGELGPGDVVGLLVVIQAKPQFSTVEALETTTVFNLDPNDLLPKAGEWMDPCNRLVVIMAKHLRELAERHAEEQWSSE